MGSQPKLGFVKSALRRTWTSSSACGASGIKYGLLFQSILLLQTSEQSIRIIIIAMITNSMSADYKPGIVSTSHVFCLSILITTLWGGMVWYTAINNGHSQEAKAIKDVIDNGPGRQGSLESRGQGRTGGLMPGEQQRYSKRCVRGRSGSHSSNNQRTGRTQTQACRRRGGSNTKQNGLLAEGTGNSSNLHEGLCLGAGANSETSSASARTQAGASDLD